MRAFTLFSAQLRWHLLGLGRQLLASAGQHAEQQGDEAGRRASHRCQGCKNHCFHSIFNV